MTASSLDEPTFADCAFFYDRSQDRASYSGQSGDQLEGQSWRAGQGAGASPVGVSNIKGLSGMVMGFLRGVLNLMWCGVVGWLGSL